MIGFELTEEQRALQEMAGRLARDVYEPQALAWDRDHTFLPDSERKRLASLGLLGLTLPAQYGGGDADLLDALIVVEELAKAAQVAAFQVFEANTGPARVIHLFGSEEQKARLLPQIINGETTMAVSISEPDAGSAATDLETRARRDGDHYVIDGVKRWCSGAGHAEQYLVYVRLTDDPGHRGIGAIVVDRETPGLTFGPQERLMGFHGIPSADMFFESVRVPATNLVVGPGGFRDLFTAFSIERLGNATMSLAIGQACLDRTARYVQEREQFGKPIVDFQLVQSGLADMIMDVEAARLLIWRAAAGAGQGAPSPSRHPWRSATRTRWRGGSHPGPWSCMAATGTPPSTASSATTVMRTGGPSPAARRASSGYASPPSTSGAPSTSGDETVRGDAPDADEPERRARREGTATDGSSKLRVLATALVASASGILPSFMVGALAAQMKSELSFTEAGLGIAVSAFFLTAGVVSVLFGRRVARMGWRLSIRIAATGTLLTLVAVPALVHTWGLLVVVMVFGGLWHALAMPASNLALARAVWRERQGLSFGIRQAAVPATLMFAGLSVPLVALTAGWRWAFAAATIFPVTAQVLVPRSGGRSPAAEPGRRPDSDNQHMASLAFAGGFAAAAVGSLSAFFVLYAVDAGMSSGVAGKTLAAASGVGLSVRVAAGWLADRYDADGFRQVSLLLAVGVLGYLLIASGAPAAVLPGAVVAFGGGWGWPGLFHFGVVRSNPGDPASASGIAQAGLSTGAALGPLVFGFVVEQWSFAVGWFGVAGVSTLAAALIRNHVRRASLVPEALRSSA